MVASCKAQRFVDAITVVFTSDTSNQLVVAFQRTFLSRLGVHLLQWVECVRVRAGAGVKHVGPPAPTV